MNGTRFGSFYTFKEKLNINIKNDFYILKSMILSGLSAVAGCLVSSPFFLIKIRIKHSGRF